MSARTFTSSIAWGIWKAACTIQLLSRANQQFTYPAISLIPEGLIFYTCKLSSSRPRSGVVPSPFCLFCSIFSHISIILWSKRRVITPAHQNNLYHINEPLLTIPTYVTNQRHYIPICWTISSVRPLAPSSPKRLVLIFKPPR